MRKAGEFVDDAELFQTIFKHLKSDDIPDQAANQMTAEMVTEGTDFDSSVELFQSYYDNYKSKGYNEHAAQAMAVEAMEGREEPPTDSLRFARVNG